MQDYVKELAEFGVCVLGRLVSAGEGHRVEAPCVEERAGQQAAAVRHVRKLPGAPPLGGGAKLKANRPFRGVIAQSDVRILLQLVLPVEGGIEAEARLLVDAYEFATKPAPHVFKCNKVELPGH